MKIKDEHYQFIKAKFQGFGVEAINNHKTFLVSPQNPRKPKDLQMRLRHDILTLTVPSWWICDNLYSYMNDEHLDTALKAIMREIMA